MVDAKFEDLEDPFDDSPSDNDFLRHSDRAMQTLGQLMSYSTAHLATQFRTHIFSVLLFRKSARLMRWDRAGLIVSKRIPLETSDLVDFFWRFSEASLKNRGHDPTVTFFEFIKDLTKVFLISQLQLAADLGDVKMEDVNYFQMLLPRQKHCYVIGKATYLGVASLASRATRSFKAWCLTTNRPVFLKDTWHINSAARSPEHEIYGKLANAKVKYIATVHDYSDIDDYLMLTGKQAGESWVCSKKLKPFHTL